MPVLGPWGDGADLLNPVTDRSGGLVSASTGKTRRSKISRERTRKLTFVLLLLLLAPCSVRPSLLRDYQERDLKQNQKGAVFASPKEK